MNEARAFGFAISEISKDSETQRAICKIVGISQKDLPLLYHGQIKLSAELANQVVSACGVSIDSVLMNIEERYAEYLAQLLPEFSSMEEREQFLDTVNGYIDGKARSD